MKSAVKRFQFIPQHSVVEGHFIQLYPDTHIDVLTMTVCMYSVYVYDLALAISSICSNSNLGEIFYPLKWFGNWHRVPHGFPLSDECSQLSFHRVCMAIAAYWVLNVACCPTQRVGWNAEHVALPHAPSYFTISNNTKTARPACHSWLMEGNTQNPKAQLCLTKGIRLLNIVLKQVKCQHVIAVFLMKSHYALQNDHL